MQSPNRVSFIQKSLSRAHGLAGLSPDTLGGLVFGRRCYRTDDELALRRLALKRRNNDFTTDSTAGKSEAAAIQGKPRPSCCLCWQIFPSRLPGPFPVF